MSDSSTYLGQFQEALAAQGTDPIPLAREAGALELLSGAELEQALKLFGASANRVQSTWDSDYGALLLEALADRCADAQRKARFYEAAASRAAVFTSWATAGGEALARKIDVDRIEEKLAALRTIG